MGRNSKDFQNKSNLSRNPGVGRQVANRIYGGTRGTFGDYNIGSMYETSGNESAYTHQSTVNGNIDTVRKPIKGGKIKK
jgi:Holliday junction resolvasome RuvABC DNA-binding subunit